MRPHVPMPRFYRLLPLLVFLLAFFRPHPCRHLVQQLLPNHPVHCPALFWPARALPGLWAFLAMLLAAAIFPHLHILPLLSLFLLDSSQLQQVTLRAAIGLQLLFPFELLFANPLFLSLSRAAFPGRRLVLDAAVR